MKATLRLTIQVAWAYLGLVSSYALAAFFRSAFFGHVPLPFAHGDWIWRISNACATLLFLLILIGLIFMAWRTLFRFSEGSIAATVDLAVLIMLFTALYGDIHYLQPLINAHIRSGGGPLLPLADLAVIVGSAFGAWKFSTVMPRVLSKVLFPWPERPTVL